ncbi:hypothetical protein H5T58_03410 [Candidatus Parcubacteria bacterium]|nr:hypothetical protein [Candidatus Parcubacteria bacterium]
MLFILFFLFLGPSFAFLMQSQHYKIPYDSLNIGGESQASLRYKMEDTIGEISSGILTSSFFKIKSGYQFSQAIYLAISVPSQIELLPPIPGLSGGQSNATVTVNLITDNPAGYTLFVKATSSPALLCQSQCQVGIDHFDDYLPQNPQIPDFQWQVASGQAKFGFTPEGESIIQKYKDNGTVCNSGGNDTPLACWNGFSTSNETIAQSFQSNHPDGTQINLRLRAECGSNCFQPAGIYQATLILTLVPN